MFKVQVSCSDVKTGDPAPTLRIDGSAPSRILFHRHPPGGSGSHPLPERPCPTSSSMHLCPATLLALAFKTGQMCDVCQQDARKKLYHSGPVL